MQPEREVVRPWHVDLGLRREVLLDAIEHAQHVDGCRGAGADVGGATEGPADGMKSNSHAWRSFIEYVIRSFPFSWFERKSNNALRLSVRCAIELEFSSLYGLKPLV